VPDRLPAPPVIEHPGPRKRALHAEDNLVNAMVLRAMFDLRDDRSPTTVHNGVLLLAALREGPAGTHVTCIALSARGHPEQMVKALDAGFDDYWTKPIGLAALNRRLDALGGVEQEEHSLRVSVGRTPFVLATNGGRLPFRLKPACRSELREYRGNARRRAAPRPLRRDLEG
jgi:hypothetical protein